MKDRNDRIAGVLTGQACGDALGAPYEFRTPPECGTARFGPGTFGHEPGSYTDDTEQAACVAAGRSEPLTVASNLLAWYGGHPKDVGMQTSAVMSRAKTPAGLLAASRAYAKRQESQPRPAGWDPGSGNGSLMRTGPVCLPYLGDREQIARAAREISDLTHADVWAGDAATLWSLAIGRVISAGAVANAGSRAAAGLVPDGLDLIPAERAGFWYAAIDEALRSRPDRFTANGSAVGCFKAALSAVAHADGLEDGLQIAVSIGNDTDTVAAVAGALLGAVHGASSVPQEWRAAIHGWPGMDADGLERLALEAAGCTQPA